MDHYEQKELVTARREANHHRYEAHSKSMLKKHVETKFRTTMIGALAQFEELFGELWGHGVREDQLTEKELDYRDKWELARTEILNKGNDQLRAAKNEIDQYTIKFNKTKYTFPLKDKEGLTRDE